MENVKTNKILGKKIFSKKFKSKFFKLEVAV